MLVTIVTNWLTDLSKNFKKSICIKKSINQSISVAYVYSMISHTYSMIEDGCRWRYTSLDVCKSAGCRWVIHSTDRINQSINQLIKSINRINHLITDPSRSQSRDYKRQFSGHGEPTLAPILLRQLPTGDLRTGIQRCQECTCRIYEARLCQWFVCVSVA